MILEPMEYWIQMMHDQIANIAFKPKDSTKIVPMGCAELKRDS